MPDIRDRVTRCQRARYKVIDAGFARPQQASGARAGHCDMSSRGGGVGDSSIGFGVAEAHLPWSLEYRRAMLSPCRVAPRTHREWLRTATHGPGGIGISLWTS